MLHAQEEEQRRIARELHDEVGQMLSAVKMELTTGSRSGVATKSSVRSIALSRRPGTGVAWACWGFASVARNCEDQCR